jgi:hypothetical protein
MKKTNQQEYIIRTIRRGDFLWTLDKQTEHKPP